MSRGIDYSGPGATCNRDAATGIRYGVIPVHEITQAWHDSAEPDFGPPHCPHCGNEASPVKSGVAYARYKHAEHECSDYVCHACRKVFGGESAFPDETCSSYLDDGEYKAFDDDSGDVWFTKSPFYTRAQFCSPCAPGACYLLNECPEGEKTYCPGHDFFEGGKAPFHVYRVADDTEVPPEATPAV